MAHAIQIGKAAMLAGVSVDTIRFYQKLGLIERANRTDSGYRLFDEEQVHDLKFVRHAQELGFSLAEVKELLSLRQKPHACAQVQSMITGKLSDVRNKIKSLAGLEAELQGALRACNRELRLERGIKHDDCCPLLKRLDRSDDAGKRRPSGSNRGRGKR
jgi:MerR family Zn(II)-responsive transcriptional regulator of zntA